MHTVLPEKAPAHALRRAGRAGGLLANNDLSFGEGVKKGVCCAQEGSDRTVNAKRTSWDLLISWFMRMAINGQLSRSRRRLSADDARERPISGRNRTQKTQRLSAQA